MKDRRHKVHYVQSTRVDIGMCGLDGLLTYHPNDMTCHICRFRYLAMQTPWAQNFLDELRGKVGRGQPASTKTLDIAGSGFKPGIADFKAMAAAAGLPESYLFGTFDPVSIPATAAEPVDGKVEDTGHGQTGPFSQQRVTQEAVSKVLPIGPAFERTVKEVMDNGGPAAESIWIQPGQVPECPGDTGQISYEPSRYRKFD